MRKKKKVTSGWNPPQGEGSRGMENKTHNGPSNCPSCPRSLCLGCSCCPQTASTPHLSISHLISLNPSYMPWLVTLFLMSPAQMEDPLLCRVILICSVLYGVYIIIWVWCYDYSWAHLSPSQTPSSPRTPTLGAWHIARSMARDEYLLVTLIN